MLEDIIKLSERYRQYITTLKQEGYRILGYCRKSKTTECNASVVKSLQSMVVGLRKRFLVENVYVTVSCKPKTFIYRRDLKKSNIMDELLDVTDDAQGIEINCQPNLISTWLKLLLKSSKRWSMLSESWQIESGSTVKYYRIQFALWIVPTTIAVASNTTSDVAIGFLAALYFQKNNKKNFL